MTCEDAGPSDVVVVIPAFNAARFLEQAVMSVLGQTYPECRVMIVDDGSTDDTASVIERLTGPRVESVYQDHSGLSAARNRGIEASASRYVAFLDADDILLPDALGLLVACLEADPALGVAAGGYVETDLIGRPVRELRPWEQSPDLSFRRWLTSCPFIISSAIVHRRWLPRVRFDPSLERCEDWDFWLQLARAGCVMSWVRQPVTHYRVYGGTLAGSARLMRDGALIALEKAMEPDESGPVVSRRTRRHALAVAYLMGACRLYGDGQTGAARDDLARALELEPDLGAGPGPLAGSFLADWAATAAVSDPFSFFEAVGQALPAVQPALAAALPGLTCQATLARASAALGVGDASAATDWLRRLAKAQPNLAGDSDRVVQTLVDEARGRPDGEEVLFLDRLFLALPDELVWLHASRDRALGWLHAMLALDRGRVDDFAGARWHTLRAIRHDRRWLGNRGLWSLLAESLLGRRLAAAGRVAAHLRRLDVRSDLSVAKSIWWSLRAGGQLFVARHARVIPGPQRITFSRSRDTLLLGLTDRSPGGGPLIEVEDGGRIEIAGDVRISQGCYLRVERGGSLHFGPGTFLNHNVTVKAANLIRLGAGAGVSWGVTLLDTDYHQVLRDGMQMGPLSAPIDIGERAFIGCNVTVLKGVAVGDDAVVAAGAVVTRDVRPGTMVAGSPARMIATNVGWE